RFQYILFGILVATVLYLIFNPECLYEKGEYFKTEYNRYQTSKYLMHFSFLPDNPDFDVVKVLIEKRLILIYRNLETNNVGQIELPGYSVNHIIGGTSIFYDEQDNTVEIILSQNGADYFLYELYSSEYRDESKINKIFHYDLYEELQDSTIVLHNIRFYEYIFDEDVEQDFFFESYKDGYRFIIHPDFWNSLRKVKITGIEESELYYSICEGLNKITNIDFQPADIYQIMQFFVRNAYYEKVLFSLDNRDINGFVGARITGKIDANKDGTKDYLILFSGKRWICDKLMCYDKIKQEILWEREFAYGTTDEFKIFDIDNDGFKEIIFSTNAYCNEFPIDWLKKKEVGKTYISYLYILDNQGNTKIINGKPAIFESEPGLNKFHYLPIFEKSKILIGLESHNEIVERRLILYNLIDNSIDTLDIYYKSLIGLYEEDGNIIALNYSK
ncbi:MAG: hypothetical protein KAT74_10195, partial [Candidatus Cloacimonetes bacterium]|nr:hypothetical protein [Candidatus Cloacimonadota bacterium]